MNEQDDKIDGQIFFDKKLADASAGETRHEWEFGDGHPLAVDLAGGTVPIYVRRLARWKDPLTLPKTKVDCRKNCHIGPITTCCQWRLYTKWHYRIATLYVGIKKPADISGAVEDCLKTAAIVACIVALISGGTAAIAAGEKAFWACLYAKLGDELLSVRIDMTGEWGNWE